MINLDMRNKICPYPVIETKKSLKGLADNDTIVVLVDNLIATQNLEKMAVELGFSNNFKVNKISENHFEVTIVKGEGAKAVELSFVSKNDNANIIAISSDTMGNGDEELSKKLLEGFIYSLTEQDDNILPKTIIFYNRGVFLTASNKKTIEDLLILKNKGVEILSCGLCLDFYDLKETLGVGEVTNMFNISKLFLTNNVININ